MLEVARSLFLYLVLTRFAWIAGSVREAETGRAQPDRQDKTTGLGKLEKEQIIYQTFCLL